MDALVIGAGKEAVHGIQQAKLLGMHVIAFDGNDKAEGLKYADEAFVVDISKPENIFSIVDDKQLDRNNLVIIPVPIGRCLVSSAAVNERYGLVGPKIKTIEICTDKWMFHQTLRKLGLRNIHCVLLNVGNISPIQEIIPAIIKPRYGSGSRMVRKISTKEEWKLFSKQMPRNEDFIIENAVEGQEYGVDGVVLNGIFHLVLVRKKINTPPPYRQCVGYISTNVSNDGELRKTLDRFINKLASAIELKDGILHADVILNADGPFIIEMSGRPSGHRLYDIFTPLVTGIDMIYKYLRYLATGEIDIECRDYDSVFMIRYFDIESEIKRIPDKEYMLKKYPILKYECNMKKGDTAKIIDGHSLIDRGYFIIEGKNDDEICAIANNILCEFTEEENG